MGKAIALNFPTHGCLNALLATVEELVERGERVIYYCTEEFSDKIERTGAEFRPYKGEVNRFEYENNEFFSGLKLHVQMTTDKLDHNLDDIRKARPDYLIHDSLCSWGKHIASILNLPAINLMHSFPVNESSIPISRDTAALLLKVAMYKLKDRFKPNSPKRYLKKKYGIRLKLGDAMINREKLNIVFTSRHMAPEIDRAESTYHFVGPSLYFKQEQTDFPFDQLEGKTVIYISLGTLHNDNIEFYLKCIRAFQKTEYCTVLSVGFEIDIGKFVNLPGKVIVRRSVPQQKLLESVDVFITHAGMNGVNEAICNGVPMVLIPHQIEQKMVANRVVEMGMGIEMDANAIDPDTLCKNVDALISNSTYKKKALKYKAIFEKEEPTSHLSAADAIMRFVASVRDEPEH